MNIREYYCDNETINEFLEFLPITTEEDYPWMQKYISDLMLHIEKAEYELAVISSHMIYMFIIYSFILKKKTFELKEIQSDFAQDKEHCPKSNTEISPYIYVLKSDKNVFETLKQQKQIKILHQKIVKIRDNIAHCSGVEYQENDFVEYIKNCITCFNELISTIFNDLKTTEKFTQALEESSLEDVVSDFLLSPKELYIICEENIREAIEANLSKITTWDDCLNDTIPSNYGINNYEFYVDDVLLELDYADDQSIQGHFSSDVDFNINFQMASSNPDDGYNEAYCKKHFIEGDFEYSLIDNHCDIQINNLPTLDFYAEDLPDPH